MALFGRPTQQDEERAIAYRDWVAAQHPLAIASFVLGVFSFIEFGALVFPGVASIVLGVLALRKLHRHEGTEVRGHEGEGPTHRDARSANAGVETGIGAGRTGGQRFAWLGITLSVISLIVALILYLRPWSR